MKHYLIQTTIVLAWCALAGCAGFSDHKSLPTSSSLAQQATNGGVADTGFLWREEARELRTFADRHDVEADVLLQRPLPSDTELIRQRRALARQLRVAAAQIEQGADGVGSRGGFSNPL
jgi:hypothetical protein